MTSSFENLPNDIEALKAIIEANQAALAAKELTIFNLKIDNAYLAEQIKLLNRNQFAPKSETVSAKQLFLFNEAESAVEKDTPEEQSAKEDTESEVKGYKRAKPGRRPLPDVIPRVVQEHDLPDNEKHCRIHNQEMKRIGEEVSEQLDIIPARIQVIKHVRFKYACQCCEGNIKTAAMPKMPIPKSMAAPGLLAHTAVAKYEDGMPLFRQEKIFGRIGVDLPRATLASWMIKVGQLLQPLINIMTDDLIAGDIIGADETTIQVLKETNRAPQSKSYMWCFTRDGPAQKIVLFEYAPSRSGKIPARILAGFKGYLQTDGYKGYGLISSNDGVTQQACMAHVRRKFHQAWKAGASKTGKSKEALNMIGELYDIEREVKDHLPLDRYQVRQEKAKPILEKMYSWMQDHIGKIPPKSLLGKALAYMNDQWPKLLVYLDDGRLKIDNNYTENKIRPFVIGRKNWLFSDTVKGAEASAAIYSMVETAKANGIDAYQYLRFVLEKIPYAESLSDFEKLLPYNLKSIPNV